jgi:hypothetical protein
LFDRGVQRGNLLGGQSAAPWLVRNGNQHRRRLAMPLNKRGHTPVLRVIDKLREVCLRFGKGRFSHMTNMTKFVEGASLAASGVELPVPVDTLRVARSAGASWATILHSVGKLVANVRRRKCPPLAVPPQRWQEE